MPRSAWMLQPPPEGHCPVCATQHAPEEPHNPDSLFWQTARWREHKEPPTWTDALAHVKEPARSFWVRELRSYGIEVDA